MSKLRLKKIIAYSLLPMIVGGCAPLVPDNYLGPSKMQTSQHINGQMVTPRLIPLSAKMLNTPEGRALLEPAMQPLPYRIGSFDNLNIIVWGHPELSTVATSTAPMPNANLNASSGISNTISTMGTNNPAVLVQTDGTIFYPYVGHVKVAGLTMDETQRIIAQRLSRYLRNPQVSVQVAKFRNRNAYVLGEVKLPGMQPLTDKPLTLMEAISTAGGIDPRSSDPSHVYVIRGNYRQPDIFWLNAQSPQSLLIAEQFPLQENDIVYVSAATFNSWNSLINTVLPSFTTFYTIKGLYNR